MKRIQITILILVAAGIFTGCNRSFEDLYQNPNKPTNSTPGLVLTGILRNMYDGDADDRPAGLDERYAQYFLCNYDYYGNNRYDFGSGTNFYSTLRNVTQMEAEATRQGLADVNAYEALGKFFRAYFFVRMSMEMGDIPMSDALQGVDNLAPKYDTQKAIFLQAFQWLESANDDLTSLIGANDKSLAGDIYFGNTLSRWQKVVNTYRLRLLIYLSKQESDTDLKVKTQFAAILADPSKYPIMTSSADNLQFNYVYPTDLYPNNPGNFGFDALRYNTSATYVNLLKDRQDPRLFITAEPADSLVKLGNSPTSFDAFRGADPGEDLGAMYIEANNGLYSLLNRKHYYDSFTGEPCIIIGYPELLFNIAEGINRGWAPSGPLGSAEAHYKQGIKESMAYYSIPESGDLTVYFLHPGASLGTYDTYTVPVDFSTYYNQNLVKYDGNTATGLNQVLVQRYIALFRQSGLVSYFNYRRTGVPTFTVGPGTGNGTRVAMRFQYPSVERTANTSNYNAAIQQYGGNDDINGKMWILK